MTIRRVSQEHNTVRQTRRNSRKSSPPNWSARTSPAESRADGSTPGEQAAATADQIICDALSLRRMSPPEPPPHQPPSSAVAALTPATSSWSKLRNGAFLELRGFVFHGPLATGSRGMTRTLKTIQHCAQGHSFRGRYSAAIRGGRSASTAETAVNSGSPLVAATLVAAPGRLAGSGKQRDAVPLCRKRAAMAEVHRTARQPLYYLDEQKTCGNHQRQMAVLSLFSGETEHHVLDQGFRITNNPSSRQPKQLSSLRGLRDPTSAGRQHLRGGRTRVTNDSHRPVA